MNYTQTQFRIRYSETDGMGYVYHGNYASFYHAARTDFLREKGISEKQMELDGIIMPVISLNQCFVKPVRFDELITIRTYVEKMTQTRLVFRFEIFNDQQQLVNRADSTVVFVDSASRKPLRAPQQLQNKLNISTGISSTETCHV